nr:hypothetical protein [uncultured Prevotella sp.]
MTTINPITLTFDLGEVTSDILAKCNLISQSIHDQAQDDIKANVNEPDSPETRSIICRAITEAFGKVKVACQRYLSTGRSTDTNALERLVASTTTDSSGNITAITYETIVLSLIIPNFNSAVTDHLKSAIHKYVVDYTMYRFLQDQVADKAKEYKDLADNEDYKDIISDLNAREKYTMRHPSFI